MLIFSRKPGESFFIGDDIEVVILDCQNDKIKVGISAPSHVRIARKELRETEKQNREATGALSQSARDAIREKIFQKRGKQN